MQAVERTVDYKSSVMNSEEQKLSDVAARSMDARSRIPSSKRSKRSMSVAYQINDTDPSLLVEDLRRSSTPGFDKTADNEETSREGFPKVGRPMRDKKPSLVPSLMSSNNAMKSFTDSDGVQLRGDKGKARRHSTKSASSHRSDQSQQYNHEWKRIFKIPYTPKYERITPRTEQGAITPKDQSSEVSESEIERRPWRIPTVEEHGPVEVHYERALPGGSWVELKPRRFTRNHKYGNHFERPLLKHRRQRNNATPSQSSQSEDRRDMYVWENPYHIWMMEKMTPN